MRKRLIQSLAIGTGAAVLSLALGLTDAVERFEFATWSWRASFFAARRAPHPAVKVILIDQSSLDWGAAPERGWTWPWPREVYVPLLEVLRRGGARAVGVDLLFTEASSYGAHDDVALAKAARAAPGFVAATFCGRDKETRPVKEVAEAAALLGNVRDEPDPDGVFRRALLCARSGSAEVPSLGAAVWLAGTGASSGALRAAPVDAEGRLLLNFAGREGQRQTFSAAAVIRSGMQLMSGEGPDLAPAVFSNAFVLVGASAPGLMDVRPTPLSRIAPGVSVHATVLDNLLTGSFLRDAPGWLSGLALAAVCWLAAGLVLRARRTGQTLLVYGLVLPLPLALSFAGYASGFAWPLVSGELGAVLALVGATLLNYATEGRQRAFIRNAFRFYLGDEVIEQILSDPDRLKLGGEKRELTIFFSDIEKFSTFSERLEPEALIALLNDYLGEMGQIIKEEGGYLDKYIGDAIVAFWNAPVGQDDHAARACRAAVRCQRRLEERRADYVRAWGVDLRARIGLNTGVVTVGNIGSRERFNYTILGDAANLASRLEGANKAFGTRIMVSENTWRRAGGVLGRELADVKVVGRKTPVRVYELAGLAGDEPPASWEDFKEGRALFLKGLYRDAETLFNRWPGDPAAHAYAARCARLSESPQLPCGSVWELSDK